MSTDYNKLTIPKLKDELNARGIDFSTFRLKAEYVAALNGSSTTAPAPTPAPADEEEVKPARGKKRGREEITPTPAPTTTTDSPNTNAAPRMSFYILSSSPTAPGKPEKGSAAKVDPKFSGGSAYKVYQDGEIWDAMLNQVDIANNNNKFYVCQLLVNNTSNRYVVFTRWGRVGDVRDTQQEQQFGKESDGKAAFCKKFKDKTANAWVPGIREHFSARKGKYTLMAMAAEEETGPSIKKVGGVDQIVRPSKLQDRLYSFIKLIFDNNMFKAALKEMDIDTTKLPLGKISKSQVEKALAVLEKMHAIIKGEQKGNLTDLSSEFYEWVPHAFPRHQRPTIINSLELVQSKVDLCNVLGDVGVAQALLKQTQSSADLMEVDNPIDVQYDSLKAHMEYVDPSSEEYKRVALYVKQTGHVVLEDLFVVRREGEKERMSEHDNIVERKLLWHGTNIAVVAAILSTGLRIMPHAGGRVGRGLYFASENSKSSSYVRYVENTGVMFLAEVCLGKAKIINQDDHTLKAAPKGYDSIRAIGWTEPDPKDDIEVDFDGHKVTMPQGKTCKNPDGNGSSFSQSEYLVYKESQQCLRYVLKIRRK